MGGLNNSYRAYMQSQVMTAPKEKLIIMMYDGILRFAKVAKEACSRNDIEEANKNLIKAQSIVGELMGSLNFEAGEIAKSLFMLYDYMHRRLIEANIKKDPEIIEEVCGMAAELKEAWQQSLKVLKEVPREAEARG
ncbi:MAG: flagellar export chaperone FliS [Clostridia bacterium]|nr:flagellar export chaperone FliS [Clostridia bacterium]